MDLSNPLVTITAALDAEVLQVLTATTGFCTAAEVHRRSGRGSDEGIRKVLDRLVEQGIVLADTTSRYALYRLNREHLAATYIMKLAMLRVEVVQEIKDELARWTIPPLHASIFGSYARGTADSSSDIDILVVRPAGIEGADEDLWGDQVGHLRDRIVLWTGNPAQIVDVAPETLGSMAREGDPLVQSWRADQVPLAGEPLLDLLRRVR